MSSEAVNANEIFSEDGLSFVNKYEFLIRYHLIRLSNFIDDFMLSYHSLAAIGKGKEIDLPASEHIWNLVIDCAENLTGIANIMCPSRQERKKDLRTTVTKMRAQAIQGLLRLEIKDRTDLVDFRNRVHHEDEDIDDWYFRHMAKAPGEAPKVVRRYLSWGTSPITTDTVAYASAYDAKTGFVHFYDKHYNLHEAMNSVRKINENVSAAHEQLTKIAGKRTEVTIL